MGALLQPRLQTERKPSKAASVPNRLDQFGRDPDSASERLRTQTSYEADTGYAPQYHAMMADLPRLCGGSAVAYAFVLTVNMLSFGRPFDRKKEKRHRSTVPLSAEDIHAYCRGACKDVRDIQRQIAELEERGMIAVKRSKSASTPRYSISLLLHRWQELEDYAVWKRKQVVAIDEAGEETEDEEQVPVSHDAVPLYKAPQSVRPGRASRAAKIPVGVATFSLINTSPVFDVSVNAVVQTGRLVASVCVKAVNIVDKVDKGEPEAKGEHKENENSRHLCRDSFASSSPVENQVSNRKHARSAEISSIFDPLLKASNRPLLSSDQVALKQACDALGKRQGLVEYLHAGRINREFSGPLAVVAFVREFVANHDAGNLPDPNAPPKPKKEDPLLKRLKEDLERRKT